VTVEARARTESLLLVTPGAALLVGGFLFPVGQMLAYALVAPEGAASAWEHVSRFFADDYYLRVAGRTFRLSLAITALTVAIGAPLAYAMARAPRALAFALLIVTVLPLMTSVVIRTFGWMIVLGRGGPLAEFLQLFGLSRRAATLLHTETGIVIAMVQVLLPFAALTILGVIAGIDRRLEEAARTMGAGFWRSMRHVVVPLALPGILSGALLVFTISISSFVTPNLVGGVRLPVMAGAIYQQAVHVLDWPFAAAQSAMLLGVVLLLLAPGLALTRRR
jgi:putative spermidine/putrescine transport system permease protein